MVRVHALSAHVMTSHACVSNESKISSCKISSVLFMCGDIKHSMDCKQKKSHRFSSNIIMLICRNSAWILVQRYTQITHTNRQTPWATEWLWRGCLRVREHWTAGLHTQPIMGYTSYCIVCEGLPYSKRNVTQLYRPREGEGLLVIKT